MGCPITYHCCKNCGHCTKYSIGRTSVKYECAFGNVDPFGICDRYQADISPSQIMRRIDSEIKWLDSLGVEDGQYKLKVRPPFGQNYRVQERKR